MSSVACEHIHTSVFPAEVIRFAEPDYAAAVFIDATTGEGGHSAAFLTEFPECRVVAIDADRSVLDRARSRLAPMSARVQFTVGWYDEVLIALHSAGVVAHRVLFDLGISRFHYEAAGRGFSFKHDEPLDMRLNSDAGQSAADIVNTLTPAALADIIFQFGEEPLSRRIAAAIAVQRRVRPIASSKELADVVYHAYPAKLRHRRIHPATKTFQALRIVVNDELGRLNRALESAWACLDVGGRLIVITFHSLEDRVVKRFGLRLKNGRADQPPDTGRTVGGVRRSSSEGGLPMSEREGESFMSIVTKKPLVPTEAEVRANPAARSAKLRVYEKRRTAAEPTGERADRRARNSRMDGTPQ